MATRDFENYLKAIQKQGQAQQGLTNLNLLGQTAQGITSGLVEQRKNRRSFYDMMIKEGYEPKLKGEKIDSKIFNVLMKGDEVDGITWEKPTSEKGSDIGGISKDMFSREQDLANAFRKDVGDYPKIRDSYGRILASAKDPSAAGDLALIFNYMKILDPGSVVREGEFATAQNSGSIPDRVWSMYNKVLRGERLNENIRKDFVSRSKSLYDIQNEQYNKIVDVYKKKAESYGVSPERVLIDLSLAANQNVFNTPKMKTDFANEQEANNANLPVGTEITINGRKAVIE
jgi:hypothetical protein